MAKKHCCDDMAHAIRDGKTISCPWCGEPMELRNKLLAWSRWADELAYQEKHADNAYDVVDAMLDALDNRPDKEE